MQEEPQQEEQHQAVQNTSKVYVLEQLRNVSFGEMWLNVQIELVKVLVVTLTVRMNSKRPDNQVHISLEHFFG